jgi:hypothetical protein
MMKNHFYNYTNEELINEYKQALKNKLDKTLAFLDAEFEESMNKLKYDQSQQTTRLYSFMCSHPKYKQEVVTSSSIFFIIEEKKEQANLIKQYKDWKAKAEEQYYLLISRIDELFN